MEIFWIKDKRQCGPSTVPDILSLIQLGELTPDSLGWHAGVQGWKPLRELPALADFLREEKHPSSEFSETGTLPEPGSAPERTNTPTEAPKAAGMLSIHLPIHLSSEQGKTKVEPPSVYLRLLARLIDTALYFALLLGVLYALEVPYSRHFLPGSPLFLLPLVFLEALCLSKWNTTFGKRICGIYVCTLGQHPEMTFKRAFYRSFTANFFGLGMLSFPFCPILPFIALWLYRAKGIFRWDMHVGTFPLAKRGRGMVRLIISLVIIYLSLVLTGVFMTPWYKPMYEELSRLNPDAARTMLRYIPELQEQVSSDTVEQAQD